MISPADAQAAICARAVRLPETLTPLAGLCGAVLREPIVAMRDQPPFDRVTMDGVAVAMSAFAQGRRHFRIAGIQAAGAPALALTDEADCLEVMTGASLPAGCNCVIPIEHIELRDGQAHLTPTAAPALNLNIHSRGLDSRCGDPLLTPGARLGPAEIAVIASTGRTHAQVTRAPRIIVISTGDELVEPGAPVAAFQIYRSNAYGVLAALQRRGYGELAQDHLPDDLDVLRTRLRTHLAAHDVLIMSGGVSMGRFDYVPQVLAELGVSVVFHKVAQRPGKPLWFGIGASGQTVYALPGNPVSTLVCLARYVAGGLNSTLGAAAPPVEFAALSQDVEVKPALTYFLPVSLAREAGQLLATPRPTRGSGDFTSLIGTDGFVELPAGPQTLARGSITPFYRW